MGSKNWQAGLVNGEKVVKKEKRIEPEKQGKKGKENRLAPSTGKGPGAESGMVKCGEMKGLIKIKKWC